MYGKCIGVMALLCLASAAAAQERDATAEAVEPAVSTATLWPQEAADETDHAEPASSRDVVIDELELERTEVTGNQELPKVMHIVPWRRSDPAELLGKPANSLLDEVLAPLDRAEFARQVRYFDDLQQE